MDACRMNYCCKEPVISGNLEDKEHLKNPVFKLLVNRFDKDLLDLVRIVNPKQVYEAGCGEGRLARKLRSCFNVRYVGSDISDELIAANNGVNSDQWVRFERNSIYELSTLDADLLLCCEVLEHLERPRDALVNLRDLKLPYYLFSVPNEPLWRILNLLRCKYVRRLGNTPGHLNHWSRSGILNLLKEEGFSIMETRAPLPWTMILCRLS